MSIKNSATSLDEVMATLPPNHPARLELMELRCEHAVARNTEIYVYELLAMHWPEGNAEMPAENEIARLLDYYRGKLEEARKALQEALSFAQTVGTEDGSDVEAMASIEAHSGRLTAAVAALDLPLPHHEHRLSLQDVKERYMDAVLARTRTQEEAAAWLQVDVATLYRRRQKRKEGGRAMKRTEKHWAIVGRFGPSTPEFIYAASNATTRKLAIERHVADLGDNWRARAASGDRAVRVTITWKSK